MPAQLPEAPATLPTMTERYFFVIDTGQLRTYQETTGPESEELTLVPVMGLDVPAPRERPGSDPGKAGLQNGEVIASPSNGAGEPARRFAAEINAFLLSRPVAHWALAVPPSMETGILSGIDPGVLTRMDTCLATRLSNLTPHEIHEQFSQGAPSGGGKS